MNHYTARHRKTDKVADFYYKTISEAKKRNLSFKHWRLQEKWKINTEFISTQKLDILLKI